MVLGNTGGTVMKGGRYCNIQQEACHLLIPVFGIVVSADGVHGFARFNLQNESCGGAPTKRVTTSWLFVVFGEHPVMVQLLATRVLISPLIHKDFPVRHLLLARGNFASVNLNHQK
jgi:hypothetical protein